MGVAAWAAGLAETGMLFTKKKEKIKSMAFQTNLVLRYHKLILIDPIIHRIQNIMVQRIRGCGPPKLKMLIKDL